MSLYFLAVSNGRRVTVCVLIVFKRAFDCISLLCFVQSPIVSHHVPSQRSTTNGQCVTVCLFYAVQPTVVLHYVFVLCSCDRRVTVRPFTFLQFEHPLH